MGNGSVIQPGDVQRMTAGTGVRHSEHNASKDQLVHLLQIWILPNEIDLAPGYEQKAFSVDERRGKFCLIASEDGREGSVKVHQDVSVFASVLDPNTSVEHPLSETRYGWLQVANGSLTLNDERLEQGDGVVVMGEKLLSVTALEQSEVLLFDLA